MNTAVLTAIEEVCLGTIGTVRTIPAASILRGVYAGIADLTLAENVRAKGRFEAELLGHERTGAVAPEAGNVHVYGVDVRVQLAMTMESEVEADQRRATRAAALDFAEAVRRALRWPGNLTSTAAAVATGAVSGCFVKLGPSRVTREDWKARIFRMEMVGRFLVKDTAPV